MLTEKNVGRMGGTTKGSMFLHPKIINCHSEVPRADSFMNININHPQCT